MFEHIVPFAKVYKSGAETPRSRERLLSLDVDAEIEERFIIFVLVRSRHVRVPGFFAGRAAGQVVPDIGLGGVELADGLGNGQAIKGTTGSASVVGVVAVRLAATSGLESVLSSGIQGQSSSC